MNSQILDRLSVLSLFFVIILLPIFFLPFTDISIETSKGLFLVVGLILSLIFWIIARLSDGKIHIPRSWVLVSGAGIVIVFLLSALFGGARDFSLFGIMFDVGTFWFILSSFLLMLLSSVIFRRPQIARLVLFGIVLSSTFLITFQVVHLFQTQLLSLGSLVAKTDNILGSWNALGVFVGFYILASIFVIEFFSVKSWVKFLLGVLILLSMFLLAVINFSLVWEIVGVFALLILVYKISNNFDKVEKTEKIHFPMFSFAIVLLTLFFFMSPGFVAKMLPSSLLIPNTEISPNFNTTMLVTKSVLRDRPILGMGPNRFADVWAIYKPLAINSSAFWDNSFNAGSGLLPTLTATTGVLGILSWLVFFVLFITAGVRSFFYSIKNKANLETASFFFLSLYLFVSSFFYFTGSVIFLLAMVFAGIFIGLSFSNSPKGEISISFFDDHRKSFFSMLVLVLMIIACAAVGFKYINRFVSVPYFVKTLSATKIEDAEASIDKALSLNLNDLYLRTYAQVYITKLNSIVANTKEASTDTDKQNLQATLDKAVNGAQVATVYNPKNYLNFQMLGAIFQTAGVIGVKDAYSMSLDAYKKASILNPNNPRLKLVLAGISVNLGDTKTAQDYANQALALKADYVDALVTLSQIAKSEGDIGKAISYGQQALDKAPGNKDLIKYVDSLRNSGGENF